MRKGQAIHCLHCPQPICAQTTEEGIKSKAPSKTSKHKCRGRQQYDGQSSLDLSCIRSKCVISADKIILLFRIEKRPIRLFFVGKSTSRSLGQLNKRSHVLNRALQVSFYHRDLLPPLKVSAKLDGFPQNIGISPRKDDRVPITRSLEKLIPSLRDEDLSYRAQANQRGESLDVDFPIHLP